MGRSRSFALLAGAALLAAALAGAPDAAAQSGYEQCTNFDQADDLIIGACTRAIQSGTLTQRQLAQAFANCGFAYRRKNELDNSLREYNEAIHLEPNNATWVWGRGVAYEIKGDRDAAIREFNEALRLAPDHANSLRSRGIAYFNKRGYAAAERDYGEAFRLSPDTSELLWMRGNSKKNQGRIEDAFADYDEAIRRRPDDAEAYRWRAFAFETKGDFAATLRDHQTARRLNGGSLRGEGRNYLYLGEPLKAAEVFAEILRNDPRDLYYPMWRYIALRRAGEDATGALAAAALDRDLTQWPGPIAEMLLGRKTYDQVAAIVQSGDPAKRSDQLTEFYFFRGQERLLAGDRVEARRLFQSTIDLGVRFFVEYAGARAELAKLAATPAR